MQQEFRIDGMHCNGCVARVTKALESIADDVQVTLDPPRATLESPEPLSLDDVQKAVKKVGEKVQIELRLETRDGKRITQPVDVEVRSTAPGQDAHKH